MDERDRLNVPGRDPIVDESRPHTTDDEIRRGSWRTTTMDGAGGYFWPVVLVLGLLVAGVLFFSWNDTPSTQVGQNTDRPTTTTAPKTPNPTQPR